MIDEDNNYTSYSWVGPDCVEYASKQDYYESITNNKKSSTPLKGLQMYCILFNYFIHLLSIFVNRIKNK